MGRDNAEGGDTENVMKVELTDDERDFLACLLYQAVGGPCRGWRRIGESIAEKLHPANVKRFSVAIETINRLGSQAVVVRQDSEKESRL